ncbi:MAG: acyl-CoA desaturase, partial [Verrucomicrobiota bacterium]
HRYFSHRTYATSRAFQFVMAVWTATAVQRGALWWASTHRHHHRHSDDPEDKHSPVVDGFWWSHVGWITAKRNFPTDYARVPDLAKYPELVFLNRFDILVPTLFFATLFGAGVWLESAGVATTGAQMLVWGVISTVVLFHGTACINSLAHVFGRRRFLGTGDDSRNSLLLSLITLGEGWHNNHHRYQATARQGFYWWEFDPTYYGLKVMSWLGLIWGLKGVPASVYEEAAQTKAEAASQRA